MTAEDAPLALRRSRRATAAPVRYWDEYVATDEWYTKELVADIPPEELDAAMVDEDWSEGSEMECGEEDSDGEEDSEEEECSEEEADEELVDDSEDEGEDMSCELSEDSI